MLAKILVLFSTLMAVVASSVFSQPLSNSPPLPVVIAVEDRDQFDAGSEAFKKQDFNEAIRLWTPLAEKGNRHAQFNLGTIYADGEGILKDYKKAASLFRKAADQGLPEAQVSLGNLYFEGQGVPTNQAVGVEWFRKAAEQGDADAQHNLAVAAFQGAGLPKDDMVAAQWFLKAAENGRSVDQGIIAMRYSVGRGVPQDDVAAYKWFTIYAANPGTSTEERSQAAVVLQAIATALTSEQIAFAKREAETWQPPSQFLAQKSSQ